MPPFHDGDERGQAGGALPAPRVVQERARGSSGAFRAWHSASGRGSLFSPIRVEAEPAGPERNDLQQAAGYRDVLEEVDELVQVCQVAVEASRGRKGEERQRPGSDSRVVAD